MVTGLRFMGMHWPLDDGEHWTGSRCVCPDRANLRAIVKNGEVIEAGCPGCKLDVPFEIIEDGASGKGTVAFFPPGTVVI